MSAALSHRLTANPVLLSSASCRSQRPRRPRTSCPRSATVARYVFSNSLQEPGRSFPQVIRIIITAPPAAYFVRAPRTSGVSRRPRSALVERAPDAIGGGGHVEVAAHAARDQRVDDRVGDRGQRAHRAGLARALGADRV